MSISHKDIEKITKLARLSIQESELKRLEETLNEVVEFVACLDEVNVKNVPPMSHAVPTEAILRDDTVKPGIGTKGLKSSAGFQDGLIAVPKFVE